MNTTCEQISFISDEQKQDARRDTLRLRERLITEHGFDTVARVALSEEDEATWMKFIKEDKTYSKYYDEFVVLFGTGMRVSEFCGLTKRDVDFENRKIHVDHQLCRERQRDRRCYFIERTKTDAGRRVIPMTDEVFIAMKKIVNNRPHVKTEVMLDGYSGFLLIDKNGNPKVALG